MLLLRTAARQSAAKKTGDCDVAAVAVDESAEMLHGVIVIVGARLPRLSVAF
jgi:hypothetical protein